jgi:adenylate cyclase class 2
VNSSGRENEIKLAAPDVPTAKKWLRAAGFRVSRRRVFESNTVFDTPDGNLRGQQRLLRLRLAGGISVITYKGPPEPGPHKSREELETSFSNHGAMEAILDRLGYRPVFTYQKYRTEYKRPGSTGIATIDETPIGVYVELEGRPAWVDRTARKLGFCQQDYILESYGRLYLQWAQSRGIQPRNKVFAKK